MDFLFKLKNKFENYRCEIDEWCSIDRTQYNLDLNYTPIEIVILNNSKFYGYRETISLINVQLQKLNKETPYHLLFPLHDSIHSENLMTIECLDFINELNIISVVTNITDIPKHTNVLFVDDVLFTGFHCMSTIDYYFGDNNLNVDVVCAGMCTATPCFFQTLNRSSNKFNLFSSTHFQPFHSMFAREDYQCIVDMYDIKWIAPVYSDHKIPNQSDKNLVLYTKALKNMPNRYPVNLLSGLLKNAME